MKENTKNVLLGVLIVGLVAMTVAYAALSTTLRISGTASVPATTWNVHFDNWTKADGTTNTATNGSPLASLVSGQQNRGTASAITVTNGTAVDDVAIELFQPGDNVSYDFDIVNSGTIDAKLNGDAVISLTDSANSTTGANSSINNNLITYNVTCDSNEAMLAANGGSTHCTLTVKYNEDITNQNHDQPGQDQTYSQQHTSLTLGASWNYVQR